MLSEVVVDTHYSTDIIMTPASLMRQTAEVFLGGKSLSFYPEGEGKEAEGHRLVFSPLFSSFLPLISFIHPSINTSCLSSLYLRCFISLSWWLFPPPSPLSSILIASIKQLWKAESAAQMAGVPKPWVSRLKWVRLPWTPGSRQGLGRLPPRGERSWDIMSTNSLQISLRRTKTSHQFVIL